MHKNMLKSLQDFTAQTLNMERTYSTKKRLDTHEFKTVGTKQQEIKKITVTALKKEIEQLRKNMIEANNKLNSQDNQLFNAQDYKDLQQLKKKLNKNSITEISNYIEELKKEINNKISSLEENKKKTAELHQELTTEKEHTKFLTSTNILLEKEIEELKKVPDVHIEEIPKLKIQSLEVKTSFLSFKHIKIYAVRSVKKLVEYTKKLYKQSIELQTTNQRLEAENLELKDSKTLKSIIEDNSKSLIEAQEMIFRLEAGKTTLEQEKSVLQATMNDLERNNKRLENKNNELNGFLSKISDFLQTPISKIPEKLKILSDNQINPESDNSKNDRGEEVEKNDQDFSMNMGD
jgi:chromosome segregation ATPase